jgi:hypothetical protein
MRVGYKIEIQAITGGELHLKYDYYISTLSPSKINNNIDIMGKSIMEKDILIRYSYINPQHIYFPKERIHQQPHLQLPPMSLIYYDFLITTYYPFLGTRSFSHIVLLSMILGLFMGKG